MRNYPVWKLLIFAVVLILIGSIYFYQKHQGQKHPTEKETFDPPKSQPSNDHTSSIETLIRKIFTLSKEGKVTNSPFISGKTEKMEVTNSWGKPSQTSKTSTGLYEEYSKQHVVVGYREESVNDIRSYDAQLKTIPLNDIKKVCGEPDEVRYYQDQSTNQIILVYHVNPTTDLKWILPKPSDQEPNPKVDHISVYTQVKNVQKSAADIISGMSLDEKIGQMIIAGISGTKEDTDTKSLITKYKVGGMIFYPENLVSPKQTVQLLNQLKKENGQNPMPVMLSVDQEGGRISRLPGGLIKIPTNKEIGAINNSQFSYKVGTLLGRELKAFGFNLDFAPVLDVNSNPNNPVIGDRSFGNNPEVVGQLGIQTMKGIESQNIMATIKHFPGHGDTSVDSHLELPVVNKSLTELERLELIPFGRAIKNGADMVMVAHILMPKLDPHYPASMSKEIITEILRKQLGFSGVVITDDMTMKAVTDHFDIGAAAVDSVKAGSDIILVAHDYNNVIKTIASLKTAVQKGDISEQRINESVSRIITLKMKYGIKDTNVGNVDIGGINQSIRSLLKEYSK